MSGFMGKRGQKGGATKRRFFCLDGNCLFYYATVDPKSVVGMIWVEGCTIEALDDKTFKLLTLGQVSPRHLQWGIGSCCGFEGQFSMHAFMISVFESAHYLLSISRPPCLMSPVSARIRAQGGHLGRVWRVD